MCDPIRETEIILAQLLATIQKTQQLREEFRNSTSSLNNLNENQRQRQFQLLEIHSQAMQNTSSFVNAILQFNVLFEDLEQMKASVISQMNGIRGEMQNVCNQIEGQMNNQMTVVTPNFSEQREIMIKVRTLTGKTLEIPVHLNETIYDLNLKIHRLEGIPPDQQRFVFNGKQLIVENKLSYYNIQEGDTIHLVLRLSGAKPVILLYNENEIVNDEEVSIQLTLNDAMNIGATYPQPSNVDENNNAKKEYEWKGRYSSKGDTNACQITMNAKKYDYVFWEGPCIKEKDFNGEIIGIESEKFEEELDVLLEKLGLNERERNDFIVYWITKLSGRKGHKVTICNEKFDKEIAQLKVTGFSQILRVMLKFEEVSEEEVKELKRVDSIEKKVRPTGKYVIEWGAILA